MSEYVGTPDVEVILRKKAFQFIVPPDFDVNVSDFYTPNADPNINSDNIYFMPELGVAMVKPFLVNRSNYVDSAISPVRFYDSSAKYGDEFKYFVEVPSGNANEKGEPIGESEDEVRRRIFYPAPTLIQYYGVNHSGNDVFFDDAHYHPLEDVWKEGESDWYNGDAGGKYFGPEWETWVQDPPPGAKYPVPWIHQTSSADNVEWFLIQSGYNFTNQPFWIEINKHEPTKLDAEDPIGMNRYYRYGKFVGSYFALRLGWNDPVSGKWGDKSILKNRDGFGPYDLVFPIGEYPFIWDHGGREEDDGTKDLTEEGAKIQYGGFMADERSSEGWILPKEEGKYIIFVFCIRGKMIIKTSWSPGIWEFPQNYDRVTEYTQEKYENFFIPSGRVAILGRGFSFRMSFNPMEFNIYKDGKKRNPSGRIISQPVQERDDFQGKKGGLLDCWNYDKGEKERAEFENFLVVPNSALDGDVNGERVSASYGCDIISAPYEGNGFSSSTQSGYTSMMIPIKGSDPHSVSFDPGSSSAIVYTKIRDPEGRERPAAKTRVQTKCGFREETTLYFSNKVVEVGLNCKKPKMGPHVGNTSERFASPIVWRVKGKHYFPLPDEGEDINLTPLVENISYDCSSPDFYTVRQNFKVRFLIPKQSILYANYSNLIPSQYLNRKELIKLLTGGSREIQIKLGWAKTQKSDPAGSSKKVVFTGITNQVPIKNKFAIDTVTLDCVDRIKILEDYPIINSPWYDGMNLSDAFMHLATLSGIPKGMFKISSNRSYTEVLDMGYTLTEPALKFDNGTSVFDALKVISKRFWHVIRSNPYGIIELTDLNINATNSQTLDAQNAVIDELGLSHSSYVFYSDGSDPNCTNPFQRTYDTLSIDKQLTERHTSVEIFSVDRGSNKLIIDARSVDVDGIENPDSPDFLGYKKPMRQANPAFGTKEKARYYRELMEKHVFQSVLKVSFTTYGRPSLKPFDIIALQMPSAQSDSYFGVYNPAGGASSDLTNFIKLRVMAVSGEIDLKSEMKYSMTVTAEHR